MSFEILPGRSLHIDAQYARVGAFDVRVDAADARAIYETKPTVTSAREAARTLRSAGGHGCWVFALGTNDAANIALGSDVGARRRIDDMMVIAGSDPVLWVNTVTIATGGPWAAPNVLAWNVALEAASAAYPTMRIYDWATVAKDEWFIADGIHYTPEGYTWRARLIANALATAYPS